MPDPNIDEKPRLEIDWLKTVAGALAAVSSAVILSTLGVAGTIIGAAVGSVVISLTSSIYSASLARSRARVKTQAAALAKVGVAQAEVRRASRRRASDTAVEGHLEHADAQLVQAQIELDDLAAEEPQGVSWKERLAALPWKRIALLAVGFFLIAIVAITVFELVAGKPVSDFTGGSHTRGGTTFSDLGGGGGSKDKKPSTRTPSRRPTSGSTPSQVPTYGTTPTQAPTPSPTESGTPSSVPTQAPTTEVPTPTETASPTAGAS
jgi:hypothetical protein